MWITYTVLAALTWYNPMLGGVNCDESCDLMAAGHPVIEWYDRALACPQDFPLGTKFIIEGSRWGLADGEWTCLDRGGRVVIDEYGVVSLDLLKHDPIWGETLEVIVMRELTIDGSAQGIVGEYRAYDEREEGDKDAKEREYLLRHGREHVNRRLYAPHHEAAQTAEQEREQEAIHIKFSCFLIERGIPESRCLAR